MPDFILSPLLESPLFQQLCDQLLEQPGAAAYEIGEGARAALAAAIALKTGRQVLYIAPGDRDAARDAEPARDRDADRGSEFIPRDNVRSGGLFTGGSREIRREDDYRGEHRRDGRRDDRRDDRRAPPDDGLDLPGWA